VNRFAVPLGFSFYWSHCWVRPMSRFIAIFLILFMGTAQAVIEAYEFESAQTEAEYYQLIKELRCLVCQNQNLADLTSSNLLRQKPNIISLSKSYAAWFARIRIWLIPMPNWHWIYDTRPIRCCPVVTPRTR